MNCAVKLAFFPQIPATHPMVFCLAVPIALQVPMQHAAKADAARCVGLCSALLGMGQNAVLETRVCLAAKRSGIEDGKQRPCGGDAQ